MKYYELDAVKSDSRIVERFFEDGRRFIKYVPFNPKILGALQEQFKDKPITVELKQGWIIITKTGFDESMANAAKSVVGEDEEITVERIAEEEKKMLQSVGYKVSYVMGGVE